MNIIAAVADNGAIGKDNALLWHISEDMKYFRSLTTGGTVIMGRKTYESIGRPLPKRRNIVISRTMTPAEGVEIVPSLEEALRASQTEPPVVSTEAERPAHQDGQVFVIGGGEIYRQAMEFADRLYITHVHISPENADTFFPEISPDKWKEVQRSETKTDPESGIRFEFVTYARPADA